MCFSNFFFCHQAAKIKPTETNPRIDVYIIMIIPCHKYMDVSKTTGGSETQAQKYIIGTDRKADTNKVTNAIAESTIMKMESDFF